MGIPRRKIDYERCKGYLALKMKPPEGVDERLESANTNLDHMSLPQSAVGMCYCCLYIPENHEGFAGSVRLMQLAGMSSSGRTHCSEIQCDTQIGSEREDGSGLDCSHILMCMCLIGKDMCP